MLQNDPTHLLLAISIEIVFLDLSASGRLWSKKTFSATLIESFTQENSPFRYGLGQYDKKA